MKKLTTIFLLFILFQSCESNNTTTKANEQNLKTQTDTIVDVGLQEKYDSVPKLTFETVTEDAFKSVTSTVQFNSFTAKETGDNFFIPTKQKEYQFKKYKDYGDEGWNGFELLGYNNDLSLFAITEHSSSATESLTFGHLFLLDSITGNQYNIESIGDYSVALPTISPNNKYLAYYANHIYDSNHTEIRILKINDTSTPSNFFTEYRNSNTEKFTVDQLAWETDERLLVKGYREILKNDSLVRIPEYYKAEIE